MPTSPTPLPTQKVSAATLACAVAGLAIWAANKWFGAGIDELATTLIQTIVTGAAGYIMPHADRDVPT